MFQSLADILLIHRLYQIAGGIEVKGIRHVFLITGNEDDVDLRIDLLQFSCQINAVHLRHLDIGKDGRCLFLLQFPNDLIGIGRADVLPLGIDLIQDPQHHIDDGASVINGDRSHQTNLLLPYRMEW